MPFEAFRQLPNKSILDTYRVLTELGVISPFDNHITTGLPIIQPSILHPTPKQLSSGTSMIDRGNLCILRISDKEKANLQRLVTADRTPSNLEGFNSQEAKRTTANKLSCSLDALHNPVSCGIHRLL